MPPASPSASSPDASRACDRCSRAGRCTAPPAARTPAGRHTARRAPPTPIRTSTAAVASPSAVTASSRTRTGGGPPSRRAANDIACDLQAIELGGYPHFMLKEICEQAETVRSTLRGRLLFQSGAARLNGLNLSPEQCAAIQRIVIVACGTSWHAGLVGRHVIQELAGIPVAVEYASEYRYSRPIREPGTVAIAISQSGETADTLEAMRAARAGGAIRVLVIVNVVGSTIAREADGGIYLHAGPEIGVA